MIQTINIQLTYVTTRHELFAEFSRVLGFPAYFGNNWDAFFDIMSSISTETELIFKSAHPVTGIHLVLEDFDIFQAVFPEEDFVLFESVLMDLSVVYGSLGDYLSYTVERRYSSGFSS